MSTLDNATAAPPVTLRRLASSAAVLGALGVLIFSFSLPATRLGGRGSRCDVRRPRPRARRRAARRRPAGDPAAAAARAGRPAASGDRRRRRRHRLPDLHLAGAARAVVGARVGDRRPAAGGDGGAGRRARRRAARARVLARLARGPRGRARVRGDAGRGGPGHGRPLRARRGRARRPRLRRGRRPGPRATAAGR